MGSRGPAPKTKTTVKFRSGVEAPKELTEDELAVFNEAVSWLVNAGTPPQQPDKGELERYARYVVAERILFSRLMESGWHIEDNAGANKCDPRVAGWSALQRAIADIGARFGFSPASRSRIPKAESNGDSGNPVADFLSANAFGQQRPAAR